MATPTMAVAAGSSFTGCQNGTPSFRICIARANITRDDNVQDVTQTGDIDTYNTPAATLVTAAAFRATKRFVLSISGFGWYQVTANGGTTWTFQPATGVGLLTGKIHGRVSQCVVQRNMRLINITSDLDPLPVTVFDFGKVSYTGSIRGYLQSSETPLDNTINADVPATLTLPFGTGTLAGAAVWDGMDQLLDFHDGGPHELNTPFRFTGATTRTLTPFDIVRFDATINLGNSQTLTAKCLMSLLRYDLDYATGGVIPVRFSGVLSDWAFA